MIFPKLCACLARGFLILDMKNLASAILATVIGMLVVTACSFETKELPKYVPNEKIEKIDGTKEDVSRAVAAADRFHELLNNDKTGELFDWIDSKSQLKADPVAWSVRMGRIRADLGTVEHSELKRSSVFKKSATYEVRLEYVSKFSKETDSRPRYELFFFEFYPNGDTKLLEYINGIDNEKKY